MKVDRGQLEQVILNLAVNARDAMPDGGTLRIATGCQDVVEADPAAPLDLKAGPYVRLTVQDSGVGMSAMVRERAFEPFFTTKGPGKGTGLGLATVYGIVKQSGGAVALDSEPGRGTTVSIYLPCVAEPPVVEPADVAARPEARRATALVAEDEPLVRDLVRRALTRAGFEVLAAEDGYAALDLARHHPGPIHLLVSDVVMPRMGGRELASWLLAERPGLRVLFMSGYASDTETAPDQAVPGSAFLHKPFGPALLVERVNALLGARD